ncbi:L-type lectin-domain containing receptor kinase VII.1 [Vitis vinifera]|uniref:L-type lectin-domain containing receptor kinase VII.1 n=1 Tax=Vitis vinifera TaxID=29760 RepID=A0A438DQX7_VITVI|nr:L-type lectin-domain containing receptor kinase VII.1 [Vitis vinifera]
MEASKSEKEGGNGRMGIGVLAHRITHQEIEAATNGFSEENVIGTGGNGKVYKGVLEGGAEIE